MADPEAAIDTIAMTERYRRDLRSSGADVQLSLERQVLLGSATAARQRAMARLRERLAPAGIDAERVLVDHAGSESQGSIVVAIAFFAGLILLVARLPLYYAGAVAGVPLALRLAGALNWPRRVSYRLRVRCGDSDQVRKVIDAVQDAQVEMSGVSWRFEADAPKEEWVEECIRRANTRAERAAKTLGVRILGVHRYEEQWSLPGERAAPEPIDLSASSVRYSRRASAEVDDVPVSTSDHASVVVRVVYRVGEYRPPGAGAS